MQLVTNNYAEYWAREWDPYVREICAPLSRHFGCEFEVTPTGGGCMAIQAQLENGDSILVTDAEDILSEWTLRQKCWRNDRQSLGFMVGYYRDGDISTEATCYVVFRVARDWQALAIAVRAALRLAARVAAAPGTEGRILEL
jgi:hypothetical protein